MGDVLYGILGTSIRGNDSCSIFSRTLTSRQVKADAVHFSSIPATIDDIAYAYNISIPDVGKALAQQGPQQRHLLQVKTALQASIGPFTVGDSSSYQVTSKSGFAFNLVAGFLYSKPTRTSTLYVRASLSANPAVQFSVSQKITAGNSLAYSAPILDYKDFIPGVGVLVVEGIPITTEGLFKISLDVTSSADTAYTLSEDFTFSAGLGEVIVYKNGIFTHKFDPPIPQLVAKSSNTAVCKTTVQSAVVFSIGIQFTLGVPDVANSFLAIQNSFGIGGNLVHQSPADSSVCAACNGPIPQASSSLQGHAYNDIGATIGIKLGLAKLAEKFTFRSYDADIGPAISYCTNAAATCVSAASCETTTILPSTSLPPSTTQPPGTSLPPSTILPPPSMQVMSALMIYLPSALPFFPLPMACIRSCFQSLTSICNFLGNIITYGFTAPICVVGPYGLPRLYGSEVWRYMLNAL